MEVTIKEEAQKQREEYFELQFSDKEKTHVFCPIKDILDRVTDKWSIYVIIRLGDGGKMRFNQLKKEIEGISQRMLTVTLRHLEEDGLISRTIYPEIPPRVEYELTELGTGLLQQLISLSKWATKHMKGIIQSRESSHQKKESAFN